MYHPPTAVGLPQCWSRISELVHRMARNYLEVICDEKFMKLGSPKLTFNIFCSRPFCRNVHVAKICALFIDHSVWWLTFDFCTFLYSADGPNITLLAADRQGLSN